MRWAFSLMGAKRSLRMSAVACFSHVSAAFSGLTASAAFAAARASGSQAMRSNATGFQRSSRRCSSSVAAARRAVTAAVERARARPRSRSASALAVVGREGVTASCASAVAAADASRPTADARASRSGGGAASARARLRACVRGRPARAVVSRAASRSVCDLAPPGARATRRRARPRGRRPGSRRRRACSWKCSARSSTSARSFERAASVPARRLHARVGLAQGLRGVRGATPRAGRPQARERTQERDVAVAPPVAPRASTASTASRSFASSAAGTARARSSSIAAHARDQRLALGPPRPSAPSRAACGRRPARPAPPPARSSPRIAASASNSFDGPSSSIEPSSLYERNGR